MASTDPFSPPNAVAVPDVRYAACKSDFVANFVISDVREVLLSNKNLHEECTHFRSLDGPTIVHGQHKFEFKFVYPIDTSTSEDDGVLNKEGEVGMCVVRTDTCDDPAIVKVGVRVANRNKAKSMSFMPVRVTYLEKGWRTGWDPDDTDSEGMGLSISEILDGRKGWLHEGALSIRCMLSIVDGKVLQASPNMRRDSLKDLGSSFKELFDSQTFADVTLKIGSEKIGAHSQVLAARSAVFRTMLSAGMRESHSKEIEVTDLDVVAMKELLVFLYTGDFTKANLECDDFALSLLEAAHRFEVAALVDECTAALGGRLTVENVSERLKVADLIGCESFKEACLLYMRGHMREVKSTPSYTSLVQQRPSLLAELVEALTEPPLKRPRPAKEGSGAA